MDLGTLVSQFLGLAGVGAAIAVIINVLKYAGVVKDGTSQTWSAGLNILGLAGMFALKIFNPDVDLAGLDATVAQVAEACLVMFGYLVQLLSSKGFHELVRNVPLIGKSISETAF